MTIATEAAIRSGLRQRFGWHKASFTGEASGQVASLWALAGVPAAVALGTPGLAGATVDNTSAIGGYFPFSNPDSGNAHLAQFMAGLGSQITGLILYDILWYNTGFTITTTTAETVNSVAWPSRSIGGDTNGDGVEIWLIATATTGNAGAIANTTYSYTNQAGTSGRSAGLTYSFPATAQAGTMVPFALQGTDTGVRSVQSMTKGTSYVSGTINLIALRQVAQLNVPANISGDVHDWIKLGLPRLYSGSALFLAAMIGGTSPGTTSGMIRFTQG